MNSRLVIGAQLPTFRRERKFLTPRLRAACKFLTDLRLTEGGWPQYEGGKISPYHTFLAVCALGGADHDAFATQIASAALRMRSEFGSALGNLDIGDLANFLRILLAESQPDQPSIKQVSEELRARMESQAERPQGIRVREFANAIAALSATDIESKRFAGMYVQQILSLENAETGGWPGAPSGDPSLIATAEVVEALHHVDSGGYADPIKRGVRTLNDAIEKSGWSLVRAGADAFTQATILRALATCDSLHNDTVETGVSALEAIESTDGRGWGPSPGETSTVEATASAVRALIASEENRFVPYRIAATGVADASKRIITLESDLATLRQELDDRVSREANKILEDRNRLRKESEQFREEIKKLELETQEAQREALEEARRSNSLMNYLARQDDISPQPLNRLLRIAQQMTPLFLTVVAILYAIGYLSRVFGSRSSLVFAATVIAFSFSSYLLSEYLSIRSRSTLAKRFRTVERSTSAVSSSVLEFSDIASLLPGPIREELTYLLATRIVEMPPSIGMDYMRKAVDQMRVPYSLHERILSWATYFLQLDPYSRRAVIEQIRRQTLAL